ncbi:1,6-anhydro-N-acetylmuramyl-L-alanine amidase AmpD [Oligella ureolytica]
MAFRAGQSDFVGRGPCNPYSIGIELEGNGTTAFEDIQYEHLALLSIALKQRYGLTALRPRISAYHLDWRRYAKDGGWLARQLPS